MKRRAFMMALAALPLVKLPAAIAVEVPAAASGATWASKTPEEIIADVRASIRQAWDEQQRAAAFEVREFTSVEEVERYFGIQ